MGRFRHHLFLCPNSRPAGSKPSCQERGSSEVYAALQRAIATHEELWDSVALTTCGCLGPCFDGPNLVVYPEGVWYAGLRPEDAEEIVTQHLLGGAPVERLRYDWADDDCDD
jgi:(2Fe-2S) ferredoxin